MKFGVYLSLLAFTVTNAVPVRPRRASPSEYPTARALVSHEIRRKPPFLVEAMGPLAFGQRSGDDAKVPIPGLGTFGAGNVRNSIAKFIPAGMNNEKPNGGSFDLSDTPNLGYMNRETAAGQSVGTKTKMSFGGVGQLEMGEERETGTGLLDFSKNLFPFLQLPELKSDETPDRVHTNVDPRLGELMYQRYQKRTNQPVQFPTLSTQPPLPFNDVNDNFNDKFEAKEETKNEISVNPFDAIKKRPGYPKRALAAETVSETEDSDLWAKTTSDSEGFIPQREGEEEDVTVTDERVENGKIPTDNSRLTVDQRVKQITQTVPLSDLGLSQKQVYALCAKFAKVAAKHCYGPRIEPQFVKKCQGYNADCGQFQAQKKPLGAIANSFSSGVGLTYYDWGVNGIPYYPVNEEGGIGNGHHGKIDFGSWGGGYSDNLGVRDYWSQTGEYGANWYEGTYGYKTGWSIPLVQSLGVEGGAGTQVHVPIKEGELGRPLSVTNGYHVGPYFGLADKVGVDWYNGGVSFNRGFAVPFVGVGVNTGTSVGFPSIGTIMNKMGVNGIDMMNEMVSTSRLGSGGGDASSSLRTSSGGDEFLYR